MGSFFTVFTMLVTAAVICNITRMNSAIDAPFPPYHWVFSNELMYFSIFGVSSGIHLSSVTPNRQQSITNTAKKDSSVRYLGIDFTHNLILAMHVEPVFFRVQTIFLSFRLRKLKVNYTLQFPWVTSRILILWNFCSPMSFLGLKEKNFIVIVNSLNLLGRRGRINKETTVDFIVQKHLHQWDFLTVCYPTLTTVFTCQCLVPFRIHHPIKYLGFSLLVSLLTGKISRPTLFACALISNCYRVILEAITWNCNVKIFLFPFVIVFFQAACFIEMKIDVWISCKLSSHVLIAPAEDSLTFGCIKTLVD